MKNKKGFTLVEIIVCLVLIIMVGTISIIMFNKDEKEPKDELKSLVTESASVKYLSNATEIKEIQETYGYKVYKVQELIDKGILEENKFKSLLENITVESGKDYSKIVLKYDYSNVGEIEYRYPYVVNDDIFLENNFGDIVFVKDNNNFNCKERITELYYLDENYEKKKIHDIDNANLKCKLSQSNDILENINNDITAVIFNNDYSTNLNLGTGLYFVNYVLEVGGKYYQTYENRKVVVVETSNLSIKIKDNSGNEITDTGNWHKGPLSAYISTDEGQIDINEYINLIGGDNFQIDWNISKNGSYVAPNVDSEKVLSIAGNGIYTISSNVKIKDITKTLGPITLKIDSTSPSLIGKPSVDRNLKTVKVSVKDDESGLKVIELYKNNQFVTKRDNISSNSITHTFNNISISELDNYIVKITDNAGNITEKRLNDIPYFNIQAIENSIFDFYIEVDNIRSVDIDFDIPTISTSNTEYWHKLKENLDTSYLSNTEEGLSGRYEFSFRSIADIITTWYARYYDRYNSTRLSSNIFDNLTIDANITMIDLNGDEINYDYEIKLNAYHDGGYFGSKLFSYSGWSSYIYAFNDDSDIIFELYNRGSNRTLYLKEKGETLDTLLTVYTGVDDHGPLLQSFDTDTIKYGYYNLTYRYGYDWWGDWVYKGTTTTNYIYTYNLNTNTSSYTTNTNSSYWDNNQGSTMPTSYKNGTWPKLTDQTYYNSLKDYLYKYRTLDKIDTTNPSRIEFWNAFNYYYPIFEQNDGWKSVLSYSSGDRVEYTMYFYKEEVSITQK